jgi:4-alpha-glucanotransferase
LKHYFIAKRENEYETKTYKAFYKSALKYLGENGVKDCYYGGSWTSFPKDIRDREPAAVEKYTSLLEDEIGYYKFLQFEFFKQWAEVKKYANENDIEIIGDIPFYVAGDSADTWANRELFNMNTKGFPTEVAGVPPDYFSEFGQLWGNPIYNWKKHSETGYAWWIQRVESILELVDIVRIDHFRAFESYWAVPAGEETAVNGKWKKGPQTELFDAIKEKLGALNIIAEDLGDLNAEVIELRNKLGLPGMKIIQFAFDRPSNDYLPHNFDSRNYIAYTGTHDNDTSIGWYKSTDEKTRDYMRRYLNVSGNDVNWDLIRLTISSIADYAILPMQDILGLDGDARMNTPGVSSGNWQFRYTSEQVKEDYAKHLEYLCELYNR